MRPFLLSTLVLLAIPANADDAREIAAYRSGLQAIVRHIDTPPRDAMPAREQREEARLTWKSFLDYQLALESIRARNADFMKQRGAKRDRMFRLHHAAWLAQYRAALDFIERMERHPEVHTMLNESSSEIGLGESTYAAFKFRWLNVARAAEMSAYTLLSATMGGTPLPGADDDARAILAAAADNSGPRQTMRNALKIVGQAAWQPLPTGLASMAGGPEGAPPRKSFISRAQIAELRRVVQPGDILFERRDWALTNVGLPGFWPHVALYVGTPEERRRLLGEEISASPATVVEAIGEGVRASTFEHSADADYVAVIRPRVAPAVKAEAIRRAFAYVGRPYDFEFDFVTDDRIVCSELVFKAYEGALDLPLMRRLGRSVTPPNDFVRWFDEHYAAAPRADFIAFLDGHGHERIARAADVSAFRASWKRSKWYAVTERE